MVGYMLVSNPSTNVVTVILPNEHVFYLPYDTTPAL